MSKIILPTPAMRAKYERTYVPARDPVGVCDTYDPKTGRPITIDLLRCVHCARYFENYKGRIMGWCFNCNGHSCGRDNCMKCEGKSPLVNRSGRA